LFLFYFLKPEFFWCTLLRNLRLYTFSAESKWLLIFKDPKHIGVPLEKIVELWTGKKRDKSSSKSLPWWSAVDESIDGQADNHRFDF
jgi:hypothetical protein